MNLASFPGSSPRLFIQYKEIRGVELGNEAVWTFVELRDCSHAILSFYILQISYKPLQVDCKWSVTLLAMDRLF